MFAGLVEEQGTVQQLETIDPGVRLSVRTGVVHKDVRIGDSIAINGCCLTVVGCRDSVLAFDAGPETLKRTNLGELTVGDPVNLEQMELALKRVLRQRRMFVENILLKKELRQKEKIEKLNRQLVRKVEELNLLNRIMGEFSDVDSTADTFQRVVEMAVDVAHAHAAVFVLANDNIADPFLVASAASPGFRHHPAARHGFPGSGALHRNTWPARRH